VLPPPPRHPFPLPLRSPSMPAHSVSKAIIEARLTEEARRFNAAHPGSHAFGPIWEEPDNPHCNWSSTLSCRGSRTSLSEMRERLSACRRNIRLWISAGGAALPRNSGRNEEEDAMRRTTLALLGALATAALAAGPAATQPTDNTYIPYPQEDGDELPWGLLGLLGLAGLLGLRRRDNHVHVDRTKTGTGTGTDTRR
jgi:MYXO-CTERM domain-containing protein